MTFLRRSGDASDQHVTGARAALDRGRMEAVDVELVADLLEHPELGLSQSAVRRGHVAGQRIGRLVEPVLERRPDQAEERIEPLVLLEESMIVWAMGRMRSPS